MPTQITRFGVNVEHLLQEDSVLELNFLGPVFLQFLRLKLVREVRVHWRRAVVDGALHVPQRREMPARKISNP